MEIKERSSRANYSAFVLVVMLLSCDAKLVLSRDLQVSDRFHPISSQAYSRWACGLPNQEEPTKNMY